MQEQRLCLTSELSHHRVSAILTRLRPTVPAEGDTSIEADAH